jgi:hypothetical protein
MHLYLLFHTLIHALHFTYMYQHHHFIVRLLITYVELECIVGLM